MDNRKDDRYYVKKIITDLVFILEHTEGLTQAELESNEILVDSVMFRLIQIAERQEKPPWGVPTVTKNQRQEAHTRAPCLLWFLLIQPF